MDELSDNPALERAHHDMREQLSSMRVTRGRLYHPTAEFYDQLGTDAGLMSAAKELCRWLGIKPHHLAVAFTSAGAPKHEHNRIEIPQQYQNFPYQAGALLTLGVMRHILLLHTDQPVHAQTVELATIEAGLGIAVLNGLHSKRSRLLELYHMLNQQWHVREDITLSRYTPLEYANELTRYSMNLHLEPKTWYPYISDEARHLLTIRYSVSGHHTLPMRELMHRQDARRWWAHTALLSLLIAITAATFVFVWAQQPHTMPEEAQEALNSAQTLEHAYTTCLQTAQTQEHSNAEQLHATLNRCTGLHAQYSAQIDAYNKLAAKL